MARRSHKPLNKNLGHKETDTNGYKDKLNSRETSMTSVFSQNKKSMLK
jgi:hypothetical protein